MLGHSAKNKLTYYTADLSQSTESAYWLQRFNCVNVCAHVCVSISLLIVCPLILILKYYVLTLFFFLLCNSQCDGVKTESGNSIAL